MENPFFDLRTPNMSARRIVLAASVASLLSGWAGNPASGQARTPVIELSVGLYRIEAEVAGDSATRAQGLMQRRQLARNRGMLFVFTESTLHCMWMRNTLIPLAVAFIDDQGKIINIEEMKPETETIHCAARPARYALEMNTGWFSARRLVPGAPVEGIERAGDAK